MINELVLLSKVVDPDTLRTVIAEVLDLPPEGIWIGEEADLNAIPPEGTLLRIDRFVQRGEFPMRLDFWPFCDMKAPNSIADLQRLCAALDCRCLIGDDTPAPMAMLEITAHSGPRPVSLDADKEEAGENSLVKHRQTPQG